MYLRRSLRKANRRDEKRIYFRGQRRAGGRTGWPQGPRDARPIVAATRQGCRTCPAAFPTDRRRICVGRTGRTGSGCESRAQQRSGPAIPASARSRSTARATASGSNLAARFRSPEWPESALPCRRCTKDRRTALSTLCGHWLAQSQNVCVTAETSRPEIDDGFVRCYVGSMRRRTGGPAGD